MNPTELKFWLDWYEALDGALTRGEGAITAYRDPEGQIHHVLDESMLPAFCAIRDLFVAAGHVNPFAPRERAGTQVWPANWKDDEASARLLRLVEEPAYLALDQGFRVAEPEAPLGLCRLIDLLEAQRFCASVSEKAAARCPAWSRVIPELFADGTEKVVADALPAFDLLRSDHVGDVLRELGLPREVMSPFLPYVVKSLNLRRLVREEALPGSERDEDEKPDAPPDPFSDDG